jgi:hypothetical protein
MYPRIFAGRNVRPFGLRAVPFLGLFEWVLDRLVRVEVVGLYAGRSAVGAHDLVFLGVNRVRARPVLREHVSAHGAHKFRIRHYSTPFSSLPYGTRVRTPSALSSPPTPTTFLPSFVRNVYRLAMDDLTARDRIVRNAKAPDSFEGYRPGFRTARRRCSPASRVRLSPGPFEEPEICSSSTAKGLVIVYPRHTARRQPALPWN